MNSCCAFAKGIQTNVCPIVIAKAGTSSSLGSPCIAYATTPRTAKCKTYTVRVILPSGSRNERLSPPQGSPPALSEPSMILWARSAKVPETTRNEVLAGKNVRIASPSVSAQGTPSLSEIRKVTAVEIRPMAMIRSLVFRLSLRS